MSLLSFRLSTRLWSFLSLRGVGDDGDCVDGRQAQATVQCEPVFFQKDSSGAISFIIVVKGSAHHEQALPQHQTREPVRRLPDQMTEKQSDAESLALLESAWTKKSAFHSTKSHSKRSQLPISKRESKSKAKYSRSEMRVNAAALAGGRQLDRESLAMLMRLPESPHSKLVGNKAFQEQASGSESSEARGKTSQCPSCSRWTLTGTPPSTEPATLSSEATGSASDNSAMESSAEMVDWEIL